MRRLAAFAILAVFVVLAACNALTGANDFGVGAGGETDDAATAESGSDARIADDARAGDAAPDGPLVDAGADACATRAVSLGAARAAAYPSTKAKTLDGRIDDWSCAIPIALDVLTAGRVSFDAGAAAEVEAKVLAEYDSTSLYLAYVVVGANAPVGVNAAVYLDDSVEVYIGGPGALLGNYRSVDRQFDVDYSGKAQAYAGNAIVLPAGFTAKATVLATTYVVEMKIDASIVGAASFAAGQTYAFDLGINRSDGTAQLGQLVWATQPSAPCACTAPCCCGAANDRPACDTREWGTLELR